MTPDIVEREPCGCELTFRDGKPIDQLTCATHARLWIALPLTAEEAYWYACSGTPHETFYVPVYYDDNNQIASVWFFRDGHIAVSEDAWAARRTAPPTKISRETIPRI